jgi:hypothetical protein
VIKLKIAKTIKRRVTAFQSLQRKKKGHCTAQYIYNTFFTDRRTEVKVEKKEKSFTYSVTYF